MAKSAVFAAACDFGASRLNAEHLTWREIPKGDRDRYLRGEARPSKDRIFDLGAEIPEARDSLHSRLWDALDLGLAPKQVFKLTDQIEREGAFGKAFCELRVGNHLAITSELSELDFCAKTVLWIRHLQMEHRDEDVFEARLGLIQVLCYVAINPWTHPAAMQIYRLACDASLLAGRKDGLLAPHSEETFLSFKNLLRDRLYRATLLLGAPPHLGYEALLSWSSIVGLAQRAISAFADPHQSDGLASAFRFGAKLAGAAALDDFGLPAHSLFRQSCQKSQAN